MLVWMKTRDAQRKAPRNRPKEFVPDFLGGDISKGAEVHTTNEIRDILSMPRN